MLMYMLLFLVGKNVWSSLTKIPALKYFCFNGMYNMVALVYMSVNSILNDLMIWLEDVVLTWELATLVCVAKDARHAYPLLY